MLTSTTPKIIVLVFTFLNVSLYLKTAAIHAVPWHCVVASIMAFLLVAVSARSQVHRQVTLEKTKAFKKYFPILSFSELIVFLVIPWVLLLVFNGKTTTWQKICYAISPHLFVVQTQVGLEPILMTRERHGAQLRFIVLSNFYRGIAIATHFLRYTEMRKELLSSSSSLVKFFDVYTVVSILVYIASNVIIALLWYPLLKVGDDLTAGGLKTYKGSVCIITGGASGIGREIAKELGQRGAHAVILIDMQLALAEDVASMLRHKGVQSTAHAVDVRDFDAMTRIVNETKKTYGRLDYMFNNAGILIMGPIEKIGVENFNYIFDVNVRGVHHGVQAAYPIMKAQGFGHIVNVSSLLGLIPGGQWAVAYSASKHAVVGLSTNLRMEAAKFGVRVSCFCPGTIETPIHSGGKYGKNLTGIPSEIWNAQVAKMKAMNANACAVIALAKIANNDPLFVIPNEPMLLSRLVYRLSPSFWLHNKINRVDWRKNISREEVSGVDKEKRH